MHHYEKTNSKIFTLEEPRESVFLSPVVALDGHVAFEMCVSQAKIAKMHKKNSILLFKNIHDHYFRCQLKARVRLSINSD